MKLASLVKSLSVQWQRKQPLVKEPSAKIEPSAGVGDGWKSSSRRRLLGSSLRKVRALVKHGQIVALNWHSFHVGNRSMDQLLRVFFQTFIKLSTLA